MRDIDDKHKGQHMGVWERNLPKIDATIETYAAQAGDKLHSNVQELEQEIRDWFEKQDLDDKASDEWNKLKLNSELFKSKVKHRIDELVDRGKIRLKHWTSAGSAN